MTDEQASSTSTEPVLRVNKVYIKDLSFESPAAPQIFRNEAEEQPQVSLQLNTETQQLDEQLYEVTLVVTVTGSNSSRTVFLAEVKQAGLFHIEGFSDSDRDQVLGAYCPGTLFPFAREAIAEVVQKGGLPQLVLQPINFDALYAQQQRERQAAGASASDAAQ